MGAGSPSRRFSAWRGTTRTTRRRWGHPPEEPIFFLKPATALLLGCGEIGLPPESKRVEVETELAAILGRAGHDIAEPEAMSLVEG